MDITGPHRLNHLIRIGHFTFTNKSNTTEQKYKIRSRKLGAIMDVSKTGAVLAYLDEQDFR